MPQTARDPRFVILGLVLLTTLFSACTTTIIESGAAAAVLPQISVERFLQAANSRHLHGMGRIFGTTDGDYMETRRREDVEIQMEAISSILEHQDYRIVREEMVAGRSVPATRIYVTLTVGNKAISNVPFVVVQTNDGRWLVEQVDLAMVMAGR